MPKENPRQKYEDPDRWVKKVEKLWKFWWGEYFEDEWQIRRSQSAIRSLEFWNDSIFKWNKIS